MTSGRKERMEAHKSKKERMWSSGRRRGGRGIGHQERWDTEEKHVYIAERRRDIRYKLFMRLRHSTSHEKGPFVPWRQHQDRNRKRVQSEELAEQNGKSTAKAQSPFIMKTRHYVLGMLMLLKLSAMKKTHIHTVQLISWLSGWTTIQW